MMNHIKGNDRDQLTLFPDALDDYISQDSPVRFIDAFVDSLDLYRLAFRHATLQETGRPPYHPADLLKLYLYGYLNHIRSSRQLEREAHRNVEVMWLVKRLTPDFKTIADFRRNNREPIRRVCREFSLFCRKLDLFGGNLVAIDGSKFKAVNRRDRNFTKKQLERTIRKLDEDIDRYLDEMDEADAEEPEEKKLTAEELQEKIKEMKRMREEAEELEKKLDESGETQISLTDPDSRMMPFSGGRRTDVCYNVQICVDEKYKLIPDHEVTNAVTDRDLLSHMAKRVKDFLGVDELEVLADMGYYHGKEIKACLDARITPLIPKPKTSASRKRGLFAKDDFRYDQEQDCYWCLAGEKLSFRFQTTEKNREIKYYATSSCAHCSLKAQCTRSKSGRRITRWVHEDVLDEMQSRVSANREKMKLRKQLAEHPFGTFKHHWHQGHFLTRKLPNVRAEMALSVLSYNIKRAIKVVGVQKMIEALA
jgi:transposase